MRKAFNNKWLLISLVIGCALATTSAVFSIMAKQQAGDQQERQSGGQGPLSAKQAGEKKRNDRKVEQIERQAQGFLNEPGIKARIEPAGEKQCEEASQAGI